MSASHRRQTISNRLRLSFAAIDEPLTEPDTVVNVIVTATQPELRFLLPRASNTSGVLALTFNYDLIQLLPVPSTTAATGHRPSAARLGNGPG